MAVTIRLASPGDAAAVAAIYAPYCESTSVSFETAAPTQTDIAGRIAAVGRELPWLVLDAGGEVGGYAYASRHRERAAYRWAVDTAVYVAPAFQRQGVARALYATLFELLARQGYFRACAGIALPNEASVRLHEALGFTLVGTYRRIGFKLGSWHDVSWFEADIQPDVADPAPPTPIVNLTPFPGWDEAVARGLEQLKLGSVPKSANP